MLLSLGFVLCPQRNSCFHLKPLRLTSIILLHIGPRVIEVKEAYINEWSIILVDMEEAEDEKLHVEVIGPSENKLEIQVEVEYDTDNERATVKYLPTELGEHKVGIYWRDSHIIDSPCTVIVKEHQSEPLCQA